MKKTQLIKEQKMHHGTSRSQYLQLLLSLCITMPSIRIPFCVCVVLKSDTCAFQSCAVQYDNQI